MSREEALVDFDKTSINYSIQIEIEKKFNFLLTRFLLGFLMRTSLGVKIFKLACFHDDIRLNFSVLIGFSWNRSKIDKEELDNEIELSF